MYRLGHHVRHRIWPIILTLCLLVLVASGIGVLRGVLRSGTTLTQSPPVVHHISVSNALTQHVTKDSFTLEIPASWRAVQPPVTVPTAFSWTGVSADDAARRLDVYVDHVPQSLAINRLLPVQADGQALAIVGTVSENCNDFTQKTPQSVRTGMAQAIWQDVNFVCDTANFERDVVATGSKDGINITKITGSNAGLHQVLLVYTDNNASPDYSYFTKIVQGFRVR